EIDRRAEPETLDGPERRGLDIVRRNAERVTLTLQPAEKQRKVRHGHRALWPKPRETAVELFDHRLPVAAAEQGKPGVGEFERIARRPDASRLEASAPLPVADGGEKLRHHRRARDLLRNLRHDRRPGPVKVE